jgi:hypothetical protein
MAPVAGYNASIELSGTSTAMEAEPCTETSASPGAAPQSFQVSSGSKRRLDPRVAVVVNEGGTPLPSTDYTVNYFTGTVSFAGDYPTTLSDVTVDANYLPTVVVAEARAATLTPERTELDTSILGTDQKSLILGQRSATVELELLHLLTADVDSGGGTLVPGDVLENGSLLLVTVLDGARFFRGWFRLPTAQQSIPVDDLVTSSLTWKTTAIPAEGRPGEWVSFSWETE